MRARIQDRGAARLQLRVQNIDDMVATMKNAGMTVVSQGGGPVPIPPNLKGALVGDFDNFFVTPFEPAGKEIARGSMAFTLGFIGLGTMGTPMVRNLLKGGYAVTVWARRREAIEP